MMIFGGGSFCSGSTAAAPRISLAVCPLAETAAKKMMIKLNAVVLEFVFMVFIEDVRNRSARL